jgi:hypothetical protein
MLILLLVFFLLYKTCKKVMPFVVVMAPTRRRCNATVNPAIAASDDKALRVRWSQHAVHNAFQDVVLADHVQGIFGATPVETVHAFRKGLIEHVTFLVLENVPASRKAALDNLAIQFHQQHRQTYRRRYPATDFSRGVTNLTKVTARKTPWIGFPFCYFVSI